MAGSETITVTYPDSSVHTVTPRSAGNDPFIDYWYIDFVKPGVYTVTVTSSHLAEDTSSYIYIEAFAYVVPAN